jgi:hypothetical protein
MKLTGKTIKHTAGVLAATLGLTILALPAGVSHAAVFPSGPQSSPFVARIVQGPDAGRILEGTLTLRVVEDTQLRGSLVVGPVVPAPGAPVEGIAAQQANVVQLLPAVQSRLLTNEAVVPVTGEVFPAAHTVLLSFALGNSQTFQTRLTSAPTGRSLTNSPAVQGRALTAGPQHGDIAAITIHIHIEAKGWSIDITIEI